MITRVALWIGGALAIGLLVGALAMTLAVRPQVWAQTIPAYSLPGLYSAAFDGAGIRADAIVSGDGTDTWKISTAAMAPSPTTSRYLRTSATDPEAAEWVELHLGGGLPPYLQAEEAFLSSRAGDLDWQGIREVPIGGTVGHVLTKHGENDDDYRFEGIAGLLPLASGGGLALNGSGQLHTSPSLVGGAELWDAAHNATQALPAEVPANGTAAKQYELNVPATSGRPTWVEAAAAGSGGPSPLDSASVMSMVGDANRVGISNLYSRGDHQHQYAVSIPANHLTAKPNTAASGRFLKATSSTAAEWVAIPTDEITANTAARWPGTAYTIPHEISTDQGPFTLRVFLEHRGYPSGAQMRINASGREGGWVTLSSGSPAELAFDATQVSNLVTNPSGGLVGGLPRLHIADSAGTEITTIDLAIPLVPADGIPDAPDHGAAAKLYELRVPATSGAATWVEATGGTVDQSARDAASAAQTTADDAGTAAENARSAADAAQTSANTANNGLTDLQSRVQALRNIRYVATAQEYNAAATAQGANAAPIIIIVTAAISGTHSGSSYSHAPGTLLYFAPRTSAPAARPFVIPLRFEARVGASGSPLPVGAHTIVASAKLTTGRVTIKYSRTFLVSDLATTAERWSMDSGNPSSYTANRDFTIGLAYDPTSRALTYTWTTGLNTTTISEQSIKAIGVTQ